MPTTTKPPFDCYFSNIANTHYSLPWKKGLNFLYYPGGHTTFHFIIKTLSKHSFWTNNYYQQFIMYLAMVNCDYPPKKSFFPRINVKIIELRWNFNDTPDRFFCFYYSILIECQVSEEWDSEKNKYDANSVFTQIIFYIVQIPYYDTHISSPGNYSLRSTCHNRFSFSAPATGNQEEQAMRPYQQQYRWNIHYSGHLFSITPWGHSTLWWRRSPYPFKRSLQETVS